MRRRVSQLGESGATTDNKVGSSMVLVEVDRGELPLAPRQPREAKGGGYGRKKAAVAAASPVQLSSSS